MNKILLIDVDSKIPNIALMKISKYYKDRGYEITLWRLGFSGYPSGRKKRCYIDASQYSGVFVSCIFSCNSRYVHIDNAREVHYGGTGYDLNKRLPGGIDASELDYSIYPDNKYSYGFITRGCNRDCKFCVVPKKEGPLRFNKSIDEIVKHKAVRFLDNNILLYDHCKDILQELIRKKIRCEFYQGLDIRAVDDEIAKLLSRLNYLGEYVFAFDHINLSALMSEKIEILKKHIRSDWKIKVFIYCNNDMNFNREVYPRIHWCLRHRVLPYIMRDENCFSDSIGFYTELAAWCNQPSLFKSLSFKEFLKKRTISWERKKIIGEIFGHGYGK